MNTIVKFPIHPIQRKFLHYVMDTFYFEDAHLNTVCKNDKVIMKRILKEGYYRSSDVELMNEIRSSFGVNYKMDTNEKGI